MKNTILLIILFIRILLNAQVGIGTKNPDPSSILEINVDNLPSNNKKGFLVPRISLSSNKDITTIPSPAEGLLVYNLGMGAMKSKGFYFWNGNEWKNLDNSSIDSPQISSIACDLASLDPPTYTAGVPYKGNLRIPYYGGNGGAYQTGDSIVTNGLTIKLREGKLEHGSGTLIFSVEGQSPTQSSPTLLNVSIQGSNGNNLLPFLSSSMHCVASVGNQFFAESKSTATIGPLFATNDPESGYHRFLTTPDGKFSVRVVINSNSPFTNSDLQIRSNQGTPTIIWNGGAVWVVGAGAHGNNGITFPSQGVWYGNGGGSGTTFSNSITSAWGDADIYFGSPEWRRYTWITSDANDKTVYVLEFFMGSSNPNVNANTTNCPNGICNTTKAYLKITENTVK